MSRFHEDCERKTAAMFRPTGSILLSLETHDQRTKTKIEYYLYRYWRGQDRSEVQDCCRGDDGQVTLSLRARLSGTTSLFLPPPPAVGSGRTQTNLN
jgi:hypothetical protein